MMKRIIRRSEVCCSKMEWSYVVGEVKEVVEEVKKLNMEGFVEEVLDVFSCAMVWIWDVIGINGYVINNKRIRGWKDRWIKWEKWLESNGLEFKREYMRFGANFKRKEKRERVFSLAKGEKCVSSGGYIFNRNGEIVGLDMEW